MKFDQRLHEAGHCMCRTLQSLAEQDDRGALSDALGGCASIARTLYDERRRRGQFFEAALFGEPAWDMLLDLRVQAESGRLPSVSSACIGSAAPASTAARHLIALEELGLVRRTSDPRDARRKLTELTPDGVRRLDTYLAGLALGWISKQFR